MKKKLLRWWELKTKVTPQEHANELLKHLLINPDTDYQIQTFESLKLQFEAVLREKESIANREYRLINGYLPVKAYDPNFDRPLSEIETNYEIVKP